MELNPATKISLCTVRLESVGEKSSSVGTGYCYFFNFLNEQNGQMALVPAIVTNKHVVDGANLIKAVFQIIKQGAVIKEDAHADEEEQQEFHFTNMEFGIVHHPDPKVDLCIILLGQMLSSVKQGYGIKNQFIDRSWHLDEEMKPQVRPIEPIAMIGYPNGLWDEMNNRPIARRGQTASHALKHWNGERQFVIDAACFPGSSGSPVFLFEDGLFRSGGNAYTPGTRAKLIGTLWGGPVLTAEGKLVPRAIPTSFEEEGVEKIPVMRLMMNLGFVVHADAIDDFIPLIKQRLGHKA
ncbi:MAG: S1 family peptidase [Pseudomonas sp.]|uniref:S1 family peptidase n=1 Tax=Pseudomonas sp. TaxID=306 RepID=UPI003D108D57